MVAMSIKPAYLITGAVLATIGLGAYLVKREAEDLTDPSPWQPSWPLA